MKFFTLRDTTLFAGVALVHLVASVGLFLFVFGSSMARFDTGGPSSLAERIAGWLLNILAFPVVLALDWLPGLRLAGLWGYIPLVLNASIWSLAVVLARRRLRPREQR